ncbi:hypothetical protein [Candidatus Finniella inopinata]|uniref:Uncharacterized protein n=1 Tax=Candidatus Finniella inopinata TaxID=1696036 RepID=A0A4Q7DMW0_9PROT|nr:hypothetical protein [Candidatus Finniella inopinata]RZI46176.1 hypothetical protein EQU50_04370 [Candidatus Finniella inopinata]
MKRVCVGLGLWIVGFQSVIASSDSLVSLAACLAASKAASDDTDCSKTSFGASIPLASSYPSQPDFLADSFDSVQSLCPPSCPYSLHSALSGSSPSDSSYLSSPSLGSQFSVPSYSSPLSPLPNHAPAATYPLGDTFSLLPPPPSPYSLDPSFQLNDTSGRVYQQASSQQATEAPITQPMGVAEALIQGQFLIIQASQTRIAELTKSNQEQALIIQASQVEKDNLRKLNGEHLSDRTQLDTYNRQLIQLVQGLVNTINQQASIENTTSSKGN